MSQKLKPNFTPVPNVIFDKIMRDLKPAALKVLLTITRYTYGWGKQSDRISLKQIADMAGIANRSNVHRAVKELGNVVTVIPGNPAKNQASEYRLNVEISDADLLSLKQQPLLSPGQQPVVRPVVTSDDIQRKSKEKKVARKTRTLTSKPDSRIKNLFAFWSAQYRERFGAEYLIDGKDAGIVKGLLAKYSESDIQAVMRRFLDSKDEWTQTKGGYTIGVFRSQFNKLISTKAAKSNRSPLQQMPL